MQSRDDQGAPPFGKRRHAVSAAPRQARTRVSRGRSGRRVGALPWVLRRAGIIGLIAAAAGYQLARMRRPAVASTGPASVPEAEQADPETAGAVASTGAARSTRLDPCRLPSGVALRPRTGARTPVQGGAPPTLRD